MRKLTYYIATSADGYIAGPQGEIDFFPFEGDHIAGLYQDLPETFPVHAREALGFAFDEPKRFTTVVMGRRTYEPALELGITDPYAPLETIVFSTTLPEGVTGGVTVTSEDPRAVVQALKQRGHGGIWLCGGAGLAGALAEEIDELIIKVNPVLAGDGIRLANAPFDPRTLVLEATRVFESGVVVLSYDVVRNAPTA